MKTKIFHKQMYRSFRLSLINVVLLTVVTAFFCMSMNLYYCSRINLANAEDTYSTVAIMELQGDVTERGELISPDSDDHAGYLSVGVPGYDFDQIIHARGVIDYDLRARYVAYIENTPAIYKSAGELDRFMTDENMIRFTFAGDEPVSIPIGWSSDYWSYSRNPSNSVQLNVIESAADFLWYSQSQFRSSGIGLLGEYQREHYAEQIRKLNRSDEIDHVILYPNVEYVASVMVESDWQIRDGSQGRYTGVQTFAPGVMNYAKEDFYVCYGDKAESLNYQYVMFSDQPFPVARWDDVQNDPALKEYWNGAWEAVTYNMCSYNVCLTDDITGVPSFHLGGAFLADGRMITQEEYDSGAKVCMISKQLASMQNWYVGDKLDMDLYQFEAFSNTNEVVHLSYPIYHKNTEGFFDSGTYEIVGIFDQKALTGNSGIAKSTLTMPWNLIFMPHNAVQNALPQEELPVHGALFTIWLENGSIDEFLADMDALGITNRKEGQYTPSFTFFDQGYSVIQPGLQSMHSTAKLLLILSALLLVSACVLMAWFFAQNQKHHIGIFRMLGGKKHQAVTAVLVCALVITLTGACIGSVLGSALSDRVGDTLLSQVKEDAKIAGLQAYVLSSQESESREVFVGSNLRLSAAAAAGAALLFPLLVLLFMACYIGKEPRALLPQNKV